MYDLYDNDRSSGYANDDYGLESKMDGDEEMDDGHGFVVGRKESRIPVAIKRLRTRGDKLDQDDGSADWPMLDRELTGTNGNERGRRTRQHKSALTAVAKPRQVVVKSCDILDKRKMGPHVCPDCNRTFAVVNREGVYVSFSIGIMPLLMMLVFAVVWVLYPYCAPVFAHKMKKLPAIKLPPPAKMKKTTGMWGFLGYGSNKK